MKDRFLKSLLLAVSLVLGVLIVMYFFSVSTLEDIIYLPMYVVILSFGYVVVQILKRAMVKEKKWWDWLYYIGLIAIVTPGFFASKENATFFHALTDYGTFFLIIPVLLDGRELIKKN